VNCTAQKISVSEFYTKLSNPVRTTETRAEFLKKSKSERDKLKDVGGYIGGEMQGNIRKSGYVKGRDIVTLDMDSIPAGQTDSVLNRLRKQQTAHKGRTVLSRFPHSLVDGQ